MRTQLEVSIMPKHDDALTEIAGFSLILTIAIMLLAAWALIGIPVMGENDELSHNDKIRLDFASIKNDIDSLCISETRNIQRSTLLSLSPSGENDEITILPNINTFLAFGTVNISFGDEVIRNPGQSDEVTYRILNLTYQSSNMYAENINLHYSGGKMYTNGELTLDAVYNTSVSPEKTYIPVVRAAADGGSVKEQTLGGSESLTVEYYLQDSFEADGNKYFIIYITLR